MSGSASERRIDLDWLRVIAFGLLILYHVGLFYASWDWHVKSVYASPFVEPALQLLNPWRLILLFLISGVATRFMADKMSAGQLLGSRMNRLFWPLAFGVYVIVPPQAYLEAVEKIGYLGGYIGFVPKYAQGFTIKCGEADCLIAPSFNHLWFVAYLMLYTAAIAVAYPFVKRLDWSRAKRLMSGWGFLVLPLVFLIAARQTLLPIFGTTHTLWADWYNHATFGAAFALGFAVAKTDAPFDAALRARWGALAVAMGAYAAVQALQFWWGGLSRGGQPAWLEPAHGAALQVQAWAAIIALLGFARRHLRRDGPIRRYLTEAVFPFYIIHQTAIVVFGYALTRLRLPAPIEAFLLVALTIAACLATFEIVKRSTLLAPLFGLKRVGNAALGNASQVEVR